MAFPSSPQSPSVGGFYFRVGANADTPDYPDGTLGGATAVVAANHTVNCRLVLIEGYLREVAGAASAADNTLVLVDDEGNDLDDANAPSLAGSYLPEGREGVEIKSGFGARLAGAAGDAIYRIHYRIIHGPTYGEDA